MSSAKGIIVGLGNPGKRYKCTRHNAGALLLVSLLARFDLKLKKNASVLAEVSEMFWEAQSSPGPSALPAQKVQVFFLRPQSYMNLSGRSVYRALQNYQVNTQEVLVLHDETELAFGEIRFKQGGGHRGHNGLRDIMALLGGDFARLCFGVGRPEHKADLAEYVLSDFSKAEQEQFPSLFSRAQEICLDWLGERT